MSFWGLSFSSRFLKPKIERMGEELGMKVRGHVLYDLEKVSCEEEEFREVMGFEYMIIRSRYGFEVLVECCEEFGIGVGELPRLIVVGKETKRYGEYLGLGGIIHPGEYSTRGIQKLLKEERLERSRFVVIGNNLSGVGLRDWICGEGGKVKELTLYENRKRDLSEEEKEEIERFEGCWIIFTSKSSVEYFFEDFGWEERDYGWIGLGVESYKSLRARGLKRVSKPKEYSVLGLQEYLNGIF